MADPFDASGWVDLTLMVDRQRDAFVKTPGSAALATATMLARRVGSFGRPEVIPNLVCVSTHRSDPEDLFLERASEFYRAWGLSPKNVGSLESTAEALAASRTSVERVCLVSHAIPGLLSMQLYKGGPVRITSDELAAWALSDGRGLSHTLGNMSESEARLLVLQRLRSGSPQVLKPLGLHESGTPQGLVAELIRRATDLLLYKDERLTMAADKKMLIGPALSLVVDLLSRELWTERLCTEKEAGALTAAIAGLSPDGLDSKALTSPDPDDYFQGLEGATGAIRRGWRRTITRARAKLADPSYVDVRGCFIGTAPNFLDALSAFFGTEANRPTVSGPKNFQWFGPTETEIIAPDDEDFDQVAGDILVQSSLKQWADVVGRQNLQTTSGAKWSLDDPSEALSAYLSYARVLPVTRGRGKERIVTLYVATDLPATGTAPPKALRRSIARRDAELWLANQWTRAPAPAFKRLVDDWVRGDSPLATVLEGSGWNETDPVLPDPEFQARIATT